MSMYEALTQRRSQPKLDAPAPSADQLSRWFQCAMNAPDHGRLKPWRYWTIEGDARNALGEVLAEADALDNPDADTTQLDRTRSLPLRAPMIIVAAAQITPDHKIAPPWEQICAVAAGVQNLQLAIADDGMGCMWRTGGLCNHSHVKAAFGLESHDHIVGFLYVGTPTGGNKTKDIAAVEAPFVQSWKG